MNKVMNQMYNALLIAQAHAPCALYSEAIKAYQNFDDEELGLAISELEHLAMSYAQDPNQHSSRRLSDKHKEIMQMITKETK